MFNLNLVSIRPWQVSPGVFARASQLLPVGGPQILYGPYWDQAVETSRPGLNCAQNMRCLSAIRCCGVVKQVSYRNAYSLLQMAACQHRRFTLSLLALVFYQNRAR